MIGYLPIVAPMLRIVASGAFPPLSAQAIVITSANAVPALNRQTRATPVFAVGDATADAARKAGFAATISAGRDAEALAAGLILCGRPRAARALLSRFKWGHAFFSINGDLLDAYVAAGTSAGVLAVQAAHLAALAGPSRRELREERGEGGYLDGADLPPSESEEEEEEGSEEEGSEEEGKEEGAAAAAVAEALEGVAVGGDG